jgi:hypothetical protein
MQENEIMHEGQPVAIVQAETLEAAEEAAKLVQVRYSRSAFSVADTSPPAAVMPEKGNYSKAGPLAFAKGDTETNTTEVTPTETGRSEHIPPKPSSRWTLVGVHARCRRRSNYRHLKDYCSACQCNGIVQERLSCGGLHAECQTSLKVYKQQRAFIGLKQHIRS